jgi:endonuclease YncB( thermonuclease family)
VTEPKDQKTDDSGPSSRQLAQTLGKLVAIALVVIAVILIERYCVPKPKPFGPDAKIVTIDGDTIRAGDGAEYRIFGIDAPELHQTCKEANGKSWACGRAAKARLTTLIKGGNVTCEARDKDRFGRVVAVCSAQGVPDLGDAMVRQARPAIPITRLKSRRRLASAAFGAAPSSGRPTGGWPIRAKRTEHPGLAEAYAASGSAKPGSAKSGSFRPTISAIVLMKAWAPSISAASCSQEAAVSR